MILAFRKGGFMEVQFSVPPPSGIPQTEKKPLSKFVVWLGITVGLVVLAGIVAVAGTGVKLLVGAMHEPAKAMSAYTDALIRKDYQSAYSSASPDFRAASSFADLIKMHEKLTDRLGPLKSVKQTYWHIETKNGQTASTIQADFSFERGTRTFEFELHKEDGIWRVFNYKEL
jgi:hypothetical protein